METRYFSSTYAPRIWPWFQGFCTCMYCLQTLYWALWHWVSRLPLKQSFVDQDHSKLEVDIFEISFSFSMREIIDSLYSAPDWASMQLQQVMRFPCASECPMMTTNVSTWRCTTFQRVQQCTVHNAVQCHTTWKHPCSWKFMLAVTLASSAEALRRLLPDSVLVFWRTVLWLCCSGHSAFTYQWTTVPTVLVSLQ